MKCFSEEVSHTSTNSFLNIIQCESFEEIFFDVFEIELNNKKYPAEKVSVYRGNPVVNLPIVVEGEEVLYPFVLVKGTPEILFHESNTDLPIDNEEFSFEIDEEEVLSESKQEILEQIENAKLRAAKVIKKTRLDEANRLTETATKNNKALRNTLEKARENLVEEFISVSNKIREELVNESRQEYSEMKETLDNKLVDICENLELQLKDNFKDASKIFDNNIKTLVKELYSETVYPKLEKELNDIAFQIVEKVGEIETTLDKKLDTKAEKTLVEGVSKELSAIQKANIELNDNINKGVNKALSRAGNVKTLVEKIDKEINDKISTELTNIENYFDERIQNIQEKTFDITEKSRKYIIDLVNKSKRELLEEIAKIPTEKPVEYIIESKSKDPEKVNLDKLKKEYDTIIHNKFENYKTDLRKYIAVYSGGGSVAVQFADGGVMNGDLTVVGTISASNYLGIPSGDDVAVSTKVRASSANWDSNYTTVQANSAIWGVGGSGDDYHVSTLVRASSANWDSTYNTVNSLSSGWGGGITGDYLPLSGGTVTGSISAQSLSSLSGNFQNTIVRNLSGATKLTVQAGSGNIGSGATETAKLIDVKNSAGATVSFFNYAGNVAGTYLGTIDDITAQLVNSTAETSAIRRGLNLGSNSVVSWGSGQWWSSKDIGFSRLSAGILALGNGTQSSTNGTLIVGNIGVNTSTPSYSLDTVGNIGVSNGIVMTGVPTSISDINYIRGVNTSTTVGFLAGNGVYAASDGPFLMARGNTYSAIAGQRGKMFISAGSVSSPVGTEGAISFNTGSDAVRMLIDRTGNVGINTTSPAYKLDVNGTLNATGNVTFGGTLGVTSNITSQALIQSLSGQFNTLSAGQYLNLPPDTDTLNSVTSRGNTTNNVIGVGGLSSNYIQFDTAATPIPSRAGLLQWNSDEKTLDLGMSSDITQQIGQEILIQVRNASGYQTIPNGRAVYISGRTGVHPTVRLARGDVDSTSRVLGVATQDISSPSFGFITLAGYVRSIKTDYTGTGIWGTTWNEGDTLWVSKTDDGVLTNVAPPAPNHCDIVGSVGVVSSSQGSILVSIDRHKNLEELSDINGTELTENGQILVWDNDNQYFDFTANINDFISNPVTTSLSGDNVTTIFAISGNDGITNASSLIVSIDGARQAPDSDYQSNGNQIIFSSPVLSGSVAVVTAQNRGIVPTSSLFQPYKEVSTNYSILGSDSTINVLSAATIQLPSAIGLTGRVYNIKNNSIGTILLSGYQSETIDGDNTISLTSRYESLKIQSTNSGWIII